MASPPLCLGRKKHWAAGELWVYGSHEDTPETSMGVPAPCCYSALGRKSVYVPELIPTTLVGMGTTGLEISVGGPVTIVIASRKIPVIAQGFLLPISWRHGSRENMGSVCKMASVYLWPFGVCPSRAAVPAVCS